MLTRIEIDGFKSFRGLKLDLQPFTVIAGPNAAGKSNLFDALRLLSRLAELDLGEAFRGMRGEPTELFAREPDGLSARVMTFGAEVLVPREVEDAFGERRPLKHTRLRYELEIERRDDDAGGPERLYVKREEAYAIKRTDDRLLKTRPEISKNFIKDFLRYSTGGHRSPFLETLSDKFQANQDGVQGRPRPFPISRERATATVLSRVSTAIEFPHLFALRQDLSNLVFLQLEAASERRPADSLAPDELLPDGSNIARVLARIEAETKSLERPRGQLTDIRNALASLIPGVSDLRVERDPSGRSYQLMVSMSDGSEFSSRVLSDGTLRILALLTFLYEPRLKTALLFEEPENGVHEERLKKLVDILRSSCTNFHDQNPNRKVFQIVLNTHSPIVLNQTSTSELVVADVVSIADPKSKKIMRRTRMRTGVIDTTQEELDLDSRERRLTRLEAERIVRHGENFAA